ncbi:MAG: DUF1854 domain-containing protein [Myxococcota bacterium]
MVGAGPILESARQRRARGRPRALAGRSLSPPSRKLLCEELVRVGFVLVVTGVEAIDEEIEIRTWRVCTAQGPRLFQTPRDEWPREVPGGGLLVSDVAGDLYHIPDPDKLDARSQKLLWAFVDD